MQRAALRAQLSAARRALEGEEKLRLSLRRELVESRYRLRLARAGLLIALPHVAHPAARALVAYALEESDALPLSFGGVAGPEGGGGGRGGGEDGDYGFLAGGGPRLRPHPSVWDRDDLPPHVEEHDGDRESQERADEERAADAGEEPEEYPARLPGFS